MKLRRRGPWAAPASDAASSAGTGDARPRAPPGRNPFVHELRFSALQKAQIAVLTLTLFPVRLLLATCMMLLAWPLAFAASLGCADEEPEQPLALWRKAVDVLLKALMRAMWFAGGFHRVAVKGRRCPAQRGGHPHPGATLLLLRRHPRHHDNVLHRDEGGEQGHPDMGE
ncbi:lysophosphatidylcholine acyltransferase 1-like [Dasypus novemcinctus]|uniref:lysophosphatidylcholine acyltransferase 1-like n=1 Tax=Dasypus novemcinctus TaxID=9361 RepID=UPI00265EDD0D|nr:lysophosphatidylcholine acyltransferase 1-like [Dasypus novemcinctus]